MKVAKVSAAESMHLSRGISRLHHSIEDNEVGMRACASLPYPFPSSPPSPLDLILFLRVRGVAFCANVSVFWCCVRKKVANCLSDMISKVNLFESVIQFIFTQTPKSSPKPGILRTSSLRKLLLVINNYRHLLSRTVEWIIANLALFGVIFSGLSQEYG